MREGAWGKTGKTHTQLTIRKGHHCQNHDLKVFIRCVPFHGENFSVEEFQALLLFEKNIMEEL